MVDELEKEFGWVRLLEGIVALGLVGWLIFDCLKWYSYRIKQIANTFSTINEISRCERNLGGGPMLRHQKSELDKQWWL